MQRLDDAEVNKESADAGSYYTQAKFAHVSDIVERQKLLNVCAHGFYMGVRWREKQEIERIKNDRATTTATAQSNSAPETTNAP